MRLVLMGTGPFAVPAFEALRAHGHDLVTVITRPTPSVKSRKGPPVNPVRQWAELHNIPVEAPDSINSPDSIEQLRRYACDLLVVCDYGQILKPDALATSKLGGINLHGSLLPKYRGAAPVQRALLSGEQMTGVTVIHMTPRLDGGPVLATAETSILKSETSGQLEDRLAVLGVEPTLEAVEKLKTWDSKSTIGVVQDPTQVTKAPRLNKAEALINWEAASEEIDTLVRGMQPWPIAYGFLPLSNGKSPLRIAVKKVAIVPLEDAVSAERSSLETGSHSNAQTVPPGSIVHKDRFLVQTGSDLIEILCVQPAGKKEMTGQEFLRGYQPPIGTQLR